MKEQGEQEEKEEEKEDHEDRTQEGENGDKRKGEGRDSCGLLQPALKKLSCCSCRSPA